MVAGTRMVARETARGGYPLEVALLCLLSTSPSDLGECISAQMTSTTSVTKLVTEDDGGWGGTGDVIPLLGTWWI